ncbi:DUF7346 family protein [Natrononativus amylolyticus]|uniref:DUF7346 family protein n=1 Tax=Natrononativus amylolyticus TaxID=2963434 RepID=UPI0020CF79AA|nr:hypothetical protein [Natrononativus amylolyticus]
MKTARDDDGKRYLLIKQSGTASLVRDPATGNECYVQNDRLEFDETDSALETAAAGVSPAVRTVVTAVHDDRTLGLLVELADRGPLGVRTLLGSYDLCESDLHGTLTELTAAGLIEEAGVGGERGYRATERCVRALEILRAPAATPTPAGHDVE